MCMIMIYYIICSVVGIEGSHDPMKPICLYPCIIILAYKYVCFYTTQIS